jgi:hypothetical protein
VTEAIHLKIGPARWMRLATTCIWALAALAIVTTGASAGWKLLAVAVLLAVVLSDAYGSRDPGFVSFRMAGNGRVVLTSREGHTAAELMQGHWISRWFSVVQLREAETRAMRRCLVCAAGNGEADYRRLRARLRFGVSEMGPGAAG